MAKGRTSNTNQIPMQSMLTVGKEYFEIELTKRINKGEEIYNRQIQTQSQFEKSREDYYAWNDYNSEFLKQSFNDPNSEYRKAYDNVNNLGFIISSYKTPAEELAEFQEDVKKKVNNLKQLVAKIELIKSEIPETKANIGNFTSQSTLNNDVFIVHGHNSEIKVTVALMLQRLGLNPIILHEQANSGKTIIEKFEEYSNVGFAVVLLTDDDLGKAKKDESLNARARQNVILELGYFIGKLGRGKVCPLYTKGVELPSDLYGLLYLEVDANEYWKMSLAKELKAAGYDVDANKII